MKKIINGRKYDTETAHEIASDSPGGFAANDASYYTETLYRKRTGEYFILGDGNPGSKYSEHIGNSGWVGSTEIVPLTYGEAVKWGEEHMDADEYESEFGEVDEGDEQTRLNIWLDAASRAKVERIAREKGCSMTQVIKDMITVYEG